MYFSVYTCFFETRLTGLLQISLELVGKVLLDLSRLWLDTSVSQRTKEATMARSDQPLSAATGAESPTRCRKLHGFIDAKGLITATNWFLFCFNNIKSELPGALKTQIKLLNPISYTLGKDQVRGTALLFVLKPFWVSLMVLYVKIQRGKISVIWHLLYLI